MEISPNNWRLIEVGGVGLTDKHRRKVAQKLEIRFDRLALLIAALAEINDLQPLSELIHEIPSLAFLQNLPKEPISESKDLPESLIREAIAYLRASESVGQTPDEYPSFEPILSKLRRLSPLRLESLLNYVDELIVFPPLINGKTVAQWEDRNGYRIIGVSQVTNLFQEALDPQVGQQYTYPFLLNPEFDQFAVLYSPPNPTREHLFEVRKRIRDWVDGINKRWRAEARAERLPKLEQKVRVYLLDENAWSTVEDSVRVRINIRNLATQLELPPFSADASTESQLLSPNSIFIYFLRGAEDLPRGFVYAKGKHEAIAEASFAQAKWLTRSYTSWANNSRLLWPEDSEDNV
jgi:hypothetical protein